MIARWPTPPAAWTNAGEDGATTCRVAEILAARCDADEHTGAVLYVGSNDAMHLSDTPEQVARRILALQAAIPTKWVAYVHIIQSPRIQMTLLSDFVATVNAYVERFADRSRVVCIELPCSFLNGDFTFDLLHLSGKVYKRLVTCITNAAAPLAAAAEADRKCYGAARRPRTRRRHHEHSPRAHAARARRPRSRRRRLSRRVSR